MIGSVGVYHAGRGTGLGGISPARKPQPRRKLSSPRWPEKKKKKKRKTPVIALMCDSRAAAVRSALHTVFHYA